MKKNKTRHYETLSCGMFPQVIPQGKNDGETKQSGAHTKSLDWDTTHDPKETFDKIWEWLDNPDDVNDI